MNISKLLKAADNAFIGIDVKISQRKHKSILTGMIKSVVSICQQMVYASWQPFPTIVI